jgi:hypothetical protein
MKTPQTSQAATTAVATVPQGGTALANIIPINGMDDISRLGIAVAKSGWFGSIGQSTGEMIAMTMLQERISPVTFKKKYHVMGDGSLSVASRAIVSAFKRLGGKMKLHEVGKEKCDITFSYDGNELRYCVTLQEFIDNGVAVSAKTGALKDNWAKFSGDMLYARCCSFAIRKVCPEADDGLYTSEEVADFDDAPATPKPEPVKIDKSEVISRLAKSEAKPAVHTAPSTAPAPTAANPEVVDAEVVEMSEPQAAPTVPDQPVAPNIEAAACPIKGNFFNVPFADMEPDILAFVLMPETAQRHPELTPAHVEAAKAAARAKGMEA